MTPRTLARYIRFRQHATMTACWVWTGYYTPDGYPQYESTSARAVVWRKNRGELPIGSRLRALCGNRDCVNHHHMRLVAKRGREDLSA